MHVLAIAVAAAVWAIWPEHYLAYAILVAFAFGRIAFRRFALGVLVDAYRPRIVEELGEEAFRQFRQHPTYYTRFWVARIQFGLVNKTAVVSAAVAAVHLVRAAFFRGDWADVIAAGLAVPACLGLAYWVYPLSAMVGDHPRQAPLRELHRSLLRFFERDEARRRDEVRRDTPSLPDGAPTKDVEEDGQQDPLLLWWSRQPAPEVVETVSMMQFSIREFDGRPEDVAFRMAVKTVFDATEGRGEVQATAQRAIAFCFKRLRENPEAARRFSVGQQQGARAAIEAVAREQGLSPAETKKLLVDVGMGEE